MYDPHTHSFITKIWLEESSTEAANAIWRGTITHIPGGERCYVQTLDDITAFITPYLRDMGVRLERRGRLWQWLSRLGTYLGHRA